LFFHSLFPNRSENREKEEKKEKRKKSKKKTRERERSGNMNTARERASLSECVTSSIIRHIRPGSNYPPNQNRAFLFIEIKDFIFFSN